MINKTEQEIMKNWQGDISEPVVSICCITYNHEKYIEETIDSFLMQETNFPFEIVLGEDCSTDNTRKIVEKYKENYPNIIKLIVSENNVGMQANGQRTMEACRGKYVALCEGDDYWTDAKKLQVQIDEMKKYPDVSISFHPAYEFIDGKIGKILSNHANKTKIFTTAEVILGDGDFCPTASLIVKNEVLRNLPKWYYTEAPVGDYFIQIFGSIKGGMLYIPLMMSCYRIHGMGWTLNQSSVDIREKWLTRMIKTLNHLNTFLENRFNSEIEKMIKKYYLSILNNCNFLVKERRRFMRKHKNKFTKKEIILFNMIYTNPGLHQGLVYIKNFLKKSSIK